MFYLILSCVAHFSFMIAVCFPFAPLISFNYFVWQLISMFPLAISIRKNYTNFRLLLNRAKWFLFRYLEFIQMYVMCLGPSENIMILQFHNG